MVNQELTNYIQQSLTTGIKKEDIINTLLNIGWQRIDIDEAFRQLESAGPFYRFQPHIPAAEMEVRIKKKGLALKISLLFLIISLIGGGSWSYFFFIDRPQVALRQMPKIMAGVDTLKYHFVWANESASDNYKRESKEYLDKIIEKFKSHKRDLMNIESFVKIETLNGKSVYHYKLGLDEEAAEWLAQVVYETDIGKNYDEFSRQEKESLEKIIEYIRKSASKIQKIDAYIGKNDLYLYRLDVVYGDKNYSLELSNFDNVKSSELQTTKSIKNIYNDILNNLISSI